jgi:hypothetical protein
MSKPDTPWIPRIRKGKKLTVYNGAEIGLWSGLVPAAVPIFNQIILKAMEYELTTDDSADVVVKIAGGGDGEPALGKTATHGVARRYIGSRGVEKAVIFLPSEPWQKHKNMLLMILMHEMAHAAGLEKHASDGVFMTLPNVDGGKITAVKGGRVMPPFFFSNKTVTRMKANW